MSSEREVGIAMIEVAIIIGVIGIVAAVLVPAFLCADAPVDPPAYALGEFVESTLTGQRGQVVRISKSNYRPGYYVRFSVRSETTDTHVLGTDGDIDQSPFALVWMREFELRPAEEEKPNSG